MKVRVIRQRSSLMRNLYIGILLLLNWLHFRAGQAQKVVRGVVLDKAGKQGIPGASVLVRGADKGSSTDMQGHFQLMIPADTATLRISAVGWATQ
jgi:CarboxypepD_reg-like domain